MTRADKGTRAGNFIIDMLVLMFVIGLAMYMIAFVYPEIEDSNSPAFEVLASTVFFIYYFVSELLFGKTIGKMLTRTIVVDKIGNRPKAFSLIIRSLVRLIPIEGISFLFGPVGLHDMISGTKVVKTNKPISPKP